MAECVSLSAAFVVKANRNAIGKLRGFTSSVYEFNSVLSWTIGVFLIINGLLFFYSKIYKKD